MTKQYTGKERVEAVFQRREYLDRVPVVLGLSAHLASQAGYSYKEYLLDPEKAWKTFLFTEEMLPTDMVEVPGNPYIGDVAQAYQETQIAPGTKRQRILEDKSNLKTWRYRPPKESRVFANYIEMAKRVTSALPDHAAFATVGGPWMIAAELRGIEELIYDTVDDPQFVHELMQTVMRLVLERTLAVVETGVGYVRIPDTQASCSLISPKLCREFVKPYQEQFFSRLRDETNVRLGLHICGYVDPIMEDILSLPIDWFEVDALSSLERIVSLSQGKVVIRGSVAAEVFGEGTKEQMENEVKRCVDIAARGGAFLLAPGCSVPYNAPLENIRYFLEAANHYGSREYIMGLG